MEITEQKLKKLLTKHGAYSDGLFEDLSEALGLKLRPLEERVQEFTEQLKPYVEEYGREMIFDFFKYWSDHGERGKKMRFEKEKTFNISLRLKKWQENSRKFSIVGMLKNK